jgi:hypothetical protein
LDEGKVVCCELVIPRCHTPTLLDPVEEPLNQIPGSIEVAAKADWLCPVPLRRDVCPRAMLADKCSDPMGVKASISEQHGSRFQAGQQGEDRTVVVRLASKVPGYEVGPAKPHRCLRPPREYSPGFGVFAHPLGQR